MDTETKISTKQKILNCAVDLFAVKGYKETTIREIAAAVGVKEASIYNHFPSKNAIFDSILEEYAEITLGYSQEERNALLKENPNTDGILSCFKLLHPEGREDYFLKQLYVIFQEQHRNPAAREFVSEKIIHKTERIIGSIINTFKDNGTLRQETDSDFWVKLHSSLLYTFTSRALLGIGDNSQGFSGKGLKEMLRNMYDLMLKTCGTNNAGE